MEQQNILNPTSAIILILLISFSFVLVGFFYSKKFKGLNNYLVANRSVGTFSLTCSLVASALGTWILFGPASAATWGGIGAVIGYSLGTAFPLFAIIFIGKIFRTSYPKAKTLIEVIRLRFGKHIFKLILILSIFYMTIFLIAEVTAVSILINYISGTPLWLTAFIVLLATLTYTLYGGLRASIFTDNIQFIVFTLLLLIAFSYLFSFNTNEFSFEFINKNKPYLISKDYLPNFTAGLTFFVAVAATNLFHQGNWQRVYAAQNDKVLKNSLIFSSIIIIPIVFLMGYSGLVAISTNSNVVPDLAFFELLLKDQFFTISIIVIFLSISLTVSSIDTIINAISSLIIVDGVKIIKFNNSLLISKQIIIIICLFAFLVASQGISILYLFLIADLLCCAGVMTVFYGFYNRNFSEKSAYLSIIFGLTVGLLLFPSQDFSKSILVGLLIPSSYFPEFISNSLLFISFLTATFAPVITWKTK